MTSDTANTYGYDPNGNRNTTGYVTGTGNELTNDGTFTYTYDNEGNLTKKSKGASAETWYYGYDEWNHLISVKKEATDGGTIQMQAMYSYDEPDGKLLVAGVYAPQGLRSSSSPAATRTVPSTASFGSQGLGLSSFASNADAGANSLASVPGGTFVAAGSSGVLRPIRRPHWPQRVHLSAGHGCHG